MCMGKDTTYSMNTITITVTDGEPLSAQGRLRMLMLTGLRTGPESPEEWLQQFRQWVPASRTKT